MHLARTAGAAAGTAVTALVVFAAVVLPLGERQPPAVADGYQALALPVHYWVDRDGIVREWAFGELPPDLLATSLETILSALAP